MGTRLGDEGVVLNGTNVISEVTRFSISESAERIEDTALGDDNRTYKTGKPDVTGTVECWYDSSDSTGQEDLDIGDIVTVKLRPEGTGTGKPEYSVSATITSISIEASFGAIIPRTFEWAASGALTKADQT